MELLHQLEIPWILFIQSIGAWLAGPMKLVTMVGNEEFFLLFMPILYWSIDSGLGLRVGAMLMLSSGINYGLKIAFHGSRPYWVSQKIHAFSSEVSFGFPSNHAQTATAIWGFIAVRMQRTVRYALLLLIFLIGFSRIYLGVHYISDVIGGWAIGGILVVALLWCEAPFSAWLKKQTFGRVLVLIVVSTILFAIGMLIPAAASSGWQMPLSWLQNASAAAPDVIPDPTNINSAFTHAGTWFGMMMGAAWIHFRRGGYRADGTPSQRIQRYLIGLAGVLVLWYGLGAIFPRDANLLSYSLRFFRYTLVGVWVFALAPLIFMNLGLASWGKPFDQKQKSSIL